MKRIYCFSGAQSTGKSSLINALKQQDVFPEADYIDSFTRSLQKKGLSINEEGTDLTQQTIMQGHLDATNTYIEDKIYLFDRCAIDGYAYTKYLYNHNKVSDETLKFAEDVLKECLDYYDIIFYLKPEFGIENDGVRSTSIFFRDEVAEEFENVINAIRTGCVFGKKVKNTLVDLTGSLESRVAIVRAYTP